MDITMHSLEGVTYQKLPSEKRVGLKELESIGQLIYSSAPSHLCEKYANVVTPERAKFGRCSFDGDEQDILACQEIMVWLDSVIKADYPEHDEIEYDQLKRSGTLSGRTVTPYATDELVGSKNKARLTKEFLRSRLLLGQMAVEFFSLPSPKTLARRMNSKKVWGGNTGYPFFIPGNHPLNDAGHFANLVISRIKIGEGGVGCWFDSWVHAELFQIAMKANPSISPWTYLVHYRIQGGGHKFVPLIKLLPIGWSVSMEVKGIYARFRDVFGGSAESEDHRFAASLMRLFFESLAPFSFKDVNWSPSFTDSSDGRKWMSKDISNCDGSINLEMIESFSSLVEEVAKPFCPWITADSVKAHLLRHLLGGPNGGGHLLFSAYRVGKNPSGSPYTFAINTFVNLCIAGGMHFSLGKNEDEVRSALEDNDVRTNNVPHILIYSDDCQSRLNEEELAALDNQYSLNGLSTTTVTGFVLLMRKWLPGESNRVNLISRCLQNTWYKERISPGPYTEAVGIIARSYKLKGSRLSYLFEVALAKHPKWGIFLKQFGAKSLDDLVRCSFSTVFQKRFLKEVGSDKSFLRSWLQDMTKGTFNLAEIDPYLASMLGMASQKFGDFASIIPTLTSKLSPSQTLQAMQLLKQFGVAVKDQVWGGNSDSFTNVRGKMPTDKGAAVKYINLFQNIYYTK